MGRFDALTQIDDKPQQKTPSPAVAPSVPKTPPAQHAGTQPVSDKKPEIMKSRNHDLVSPTIFNKEKPVKYSTLLDAGLVKKIKLIAAERELKDYEVIEQALTEYFEKQK